MSKNLMVWCCLAAAVVQAVHLLAQKIPQTQFGSSPTLNYLAIGTGGTPPAGQAYQSFRLTGSSFQPFAIGALQEDINGNYNFQSSDIVEYHVSPNDTPGQTLIDVGVPVSSQASNITGSRYTSPASLTNGYYLLVLERYGLSSIPGCAATGNLGSELVYGGCGRVYATGSTDPSQRLSAYKQLSSDLSQVSINQLAILTTVGQAGYGVDAFDVVGGSHNASYAPINGVDNGYQGFGAVLDQLGGSPQDTSGLFAQGSAYTLISSLGIGDSLTGSAVLSSSVFAAQKQTGFVQGLMGRDLFGRFLPSHTVQGSEANYAAGKGADFTIGLLSAQQPVPWPEVTALLQGADTMAGQLAAYHYLSYVLVTQAYIQGAQGSYLDDLHYFFTGSNNTYLNYHTLDPNVLQFPTSSLGPLPINTGPHVLCDSYSVPNGGLPTCVWTDPISGVADTFDLNDFSAVRFQLHTELIDFTNVLQFMVNGSVNMKDVVASGSSNTALALVGAAATVEASNLQPSPSTPVKVNLSNVLNLVGSAVNIAATIATEGAINKGVTVVGDLFQVAGAVAGGLSSPNVASLPSAQYTFSSTIGELATQNLQGQLNAGFDVILDAFLSDWGKLSVLGPKITDTGNSAFYSPTQAAQNLAINALNQGAQRSFYLALLPSFYSVHYWPELAVRTPYAPAMGWYVYQTPCSPFYPQWNDSQPYRSVSYPSSAAPRNTSMSTTKAKML